MLALCQKEGNDSNKTVFPKFWISEYSTSLCYSSSNEKIARKNLQCDDCLLKTRIPYEVQEWEALRVSFITDLDDFFELWILINYLLLLKRDADYRIIIIWSASKLLYDLTYTLSFITLGIQCFSPGQKLSVKRNKINFLTTNGFIAEHYLGSWVAVVKPARTWWLQQHCLLEHELQTVQWGV